MPPEEQKLELVPADRLYGRPPTPHQANRLRAEMVDRLVTNGTSRVAAHRIVAIELGEAEPGRARRHAQARGPR
jgi:hypothetical protein